MDVVCALLEQDGAYLLCQRSFHKESGGLWEFPGGKVKDGESEFEAIEREIFEELSIRVRGVSLRPVVEVERQDGILRLIPVLIKKVSGEIRLNEHEAMRWMAPEEMLSLEMCQGDIVIAKSLTL